MTVDSSQIGAHAFEAAILQVLHDPEYTHRARAVSKQLRARKRTPVQEAAGHCPCQLSLQPSQACSVRGHGRYQRACAHADWIEHVLETGGEAYMRTPQDDLSMVVRNSIDTYSFVIVCAVGVLYVGWKAACAAISWTSSCLPAELGRKGKLA